MYVFCVLLNFYILQKYIIYIYIFHSCYKYLHLIKHVCSIKLIPVRL